MVLPTEKAALTNPKAFVVPPAATWSHAIRVYWRWRQEEINWLAKLKKLVREVLSAAGAGPTGAGKELIKHPDVVGELKKTDSTGANFDALLYATTKALGGEEYGGWNSSAWNSAARKKLGDWVDEGILSKKFIIDKAQKDHLWAIEMMGMSRDHHRQLRGTPDYYILREARDPRYDPNRSGVSHLFTITNQPVVIVRSNGRMLCYYVMNDRHRTLCEEKAKAGWVLPD